jgi:hypothetical protein
MQTGNFLGKLSQLFMGNEDEKTESKAAFENLESLNGTGRDKIQNQSDSNMYETNYSHYLNHRNVEDTNPAEFDQLKGIKVTENSVINNEIDINEIKLSKVSLKSRTKLERL